MQTSARQAMVRLGRKLPVPVRRAGSRVLALPGDRRFIAAASSPEAARDLPEGFDRIYCHHVPKTAGTSLHQAFLGAFGDDGPAAHRRLLADPSTRTVAGGHAFQAHSSTLLARGRYFYGWSHLPWDDLDLPARTFRIVTVRDPADRIVSLYRMLAENRRTQADPLLDKGQGRFLGVSATFAEYLDNLPSERALRHLHQFSVRGDVAEAADRMSSCQAVVRTESFVADLAALSERVPFTLTTHHARRAADPFELSPADADRLEALVAPERALLAALPS